LSQSQRQHQEPQHKKTTTQTTQTTKTNLQTTLIITTYNRPDALALVLESVLVQTEMPLEVVIADDGSTQETAEVIQDFKEKCPCSIQHIWQKDEGFRLAQIRNKAIAASKGDYLLMLDGDMVLHPQFVETQANNAQKGYFIQGSRVLLSSDLTKECIAQKKIHFTPFQAGITNRINAINSRFLSKMLSKEKNNHIGVRGCNMAFWKQDVLRINGFNEAFQGWGREDSEFVVRLLNSGIKRKNVKCTAVAYHLYHPENTESEKLQKNDVLLEQAIESKSVWCDLGIGRYLVD